VRESIRSAAVTRVHLVALARRLGLALPYDPIISFSDVAKRLISLRLEPGKHQFPDVRRGRLVRAGVRAALRRFDVQPPLRATFCAWFVIAAVVPRRAVRRLGQQLLFPEQRSGANRLLARLHRSRG
jgi:hypothetical protein